jgi:hypothetical protein
MIFAGFACSCADLIMISPPCPVRGIAAAGFDRLRPEFDRFVAQWTSELVCTRHEIEAVWDDETTARARVSARRRPGRRWRVWCRSCGGGRAVGGDAGGPRGRGLPRIDPLLASAHGGRGPSGRGDLSGSRTGAVPPRGADVGRGGAARGGDAGDEGFRVDVPAALGHGPASRWCRVVDAYRILI